VRAWVVLVAACASQPPPAAPSNHATPEPRELATTTLHIYIQDVRDPCGAPSDREHVEVMIDGRSVGTITVACRQASAQARQFRLAQDPVLVEGRHRVGVRHVESGRTDAKEFAFPAGRPADPHQPWIELDKLRVTFGVGALSIGELSI
jgi:hypothetical protein